MHIGIKGVNALNDRLIRNLGIRMALFLQQIHLRNHCCQIDASSDWMNGDCLFTAVATYTCADLPHIRPINLAHWEAFMALVGLDHTPYLISGSHVIIDLVQDLESRSIGDG